MSSVVREAAILATELLREAGLDLRECQGDSFRMAFYEGADVVQTYGATAETARKVFDYNNPIDPGRGSKSALEFYDARHAGGMRFQQDEDGDEFMAKNGERGRDDDVHSFLLGFDMGVAWALKQKNAHDERSEASMKHEHEHTERPPAGVREDEASQPRADFGDLGDNLPF